MRRVVIVLIAGILILSTTGVGAWCADAAPLDWQVYEEGLEQAGRQGKSILIHFFAGWCIYCRKMEQDTYGHPEVADYLRQHYVVIRVDVDQEPDLAARYFVRGLPMIWFLEDSGEKITALPGYVPPDQFLRVLMFIHSKAYEEMHFRQFLEGDV